MNSEGAGADTSGGAKEPSSSPPGSSAADPNKPNPTIGADDAMKSDRNTGGTSGTSAQCDFEGVWKVSDSDGKPFQITLSADGAAKAAGREDMMGTWKEEGGLP